MLKPVTGQMVEIKSADLKVGMEMLNDGEIVKVLEVEIDFCEENAVSYIYQDSKGELWSGYAGIDAVKRVKYAPGQNLVSML